MKRGRRLLALCVTAAACLLQDLGSAWAEGDKPPKLSKEEKAYIKRMIEHGREEKQYPDKNWMYQNCRKNVNGTWYPVNRDVDWMIGRMVITGDSIIFEKIGEFRYEILQSKISFPLPDGGAWERYIFKLERSIYLKRYWLKENNRYMVFRLPAGYTDDHSGWKYRCMPTFALCPTLEAAKTKFSVTSSSSASGCQIEMRFIPYSDD
ncbi:exported hypothetical protein [Rhodospirillaceae bacterium LM-1]|nr:exported hypothetical protein [Rhodospirillaceae bacterium LM-1]